MSVVEQRGGFPVTIGGTVATTGVVSPDRGGTLPAGTPITLGANQVQSDLEGRRGPIISKAIEIRNLDATASNELRAFFNLKDFTDNANFVTIPGGASQLSTWFGPAELKTVFLRSSAGTPRFEVIAYHRRG